MKFIGLARKYGDAFGGSTESRPPTRRLSVRVFSRIAWMAVVVVVSSVCLGGQGGPSLGSPDFKPTPDRPVGFRGDGLGRFPGATPPTQWERTMAGQSKNIAWMTRLPSGSAGSPVVVGDPSTGSTNSPQAGSGHGRVFVTSDISKLLCVDCGTGKILWLRNDTIYETLTPDEKAKARGAVEPLLAELKSLNDQFVQKANAAISKGGVSDEQRKEFATLFKATRDKERDIDGAVCTAIPDKYKHPRGRSFPQQWGASTPAPCSDGKKVYVKYATGLNAAYDLEGKLQWATYIYGDPLEHGEHAPPALVDGKFILAWMMNRRDCSYFALDTKDGRILWEQKEVRKAHYGMPITISVGAEKLILHGNGQTLRASDGKVMSSKVLVGEAFPTAAYDDGIYYNLEFFRKSALTAARFSGNGDSAEILYTKPLFQVDPDRKSDPEGWKHSFCASPLFHGGLIYNISEGGILLIHDAKDGSLLVEKDLQMKPRIKYVAQPGVSASPVLAGKYIYLFGDNGLGIVIEPGRTFKEIARNSLEEPLEGVNDNVTLATPYCSGSSIFWRSQEYLYCIRGNGK